MKSLPINMDEFAFVLHRGKNLELECFLNLDTGEVISIPTDRSALSDLLKLDHESDLYSTQSLIKQIIPEGVDYLEIPDQLQSVLFDIMNTFAGEIQDVDPELYDKLIRAISGEGGYREYHRLICERKNMLKRFINFRDGFYEKSALKWLEENNIIPLGQG